MDDERIAYVDEEEDTEAGPAGWPQVDRWLTGRFSADVQLPDGTTDAAEFDDIDAALAWARVRAPRVILRLGYDRFDAGELAPGDLPRWPPASLELPLRRRRPDEERWKDRSPDDPPIDWVVDVLLGPKDIDALFDDRERLDAYVAEIVATTEAEACDATSVDGFVADLRAAEEAAGGADESGWTTYSSPVWRLRFRATASTRAQAAEQVLGRLGEHEGWRAKAAAEPA